MPNNLIILPLEGVSQTLFWQFRSFMPTLWQMSLRSIMFRRFYSNSTSAFQSFCDFAYGNSSELDHNLKYPDAKGCLLGRESNLFELLHKSGYAVLGIQHAETSPSYARDDFFGAWPGCCGSFRQHEQYEPFYKETLEFIEASSRDKKPFALYLSDRASLASDDCAEKRQTKRFHERFAKGFSLVDQTMRVVLEKLAEQSLLDDTIVAVVGMYGMDPWKHGLYGGHTYGVDPYADACWTPMFLYNNNRDAKTVDNLACVIDMKQTLIKLLVPDQEVQGDAGTFSGVNLMAGYRDVVFTQNLFALERENEGPARGIPKSYAATDGNQRLVVTSDGGIKGEGGMEFFYDPRDSTNSRNLLDFFTMDETGKLVAFGNPKAIHPHFLHAFHPDKPDWLIRTIVDSYNPMREVLRKLIKTKEAVALSHCAEPEKAVLFDESLFDVKRRRR